jgi:CrcB protein
VSRPSATPLAVAVVAAGGAGGAVLRWWLGELVPDGSRFPWTTFAINVAGSLLLATLPAFEVVRRRVLVALALGPGLLGGFTTLSTYAEESRALLADGQTGTSTAYLLGTLAACLVAVSIGHRLSTQAEQRAFDEEEGNE